MSRSLADQVNRQIDRTESAMNVRFLELQSKLLSMQVGTLEQALAEREKK